MNGSVVLSGAIRMLALCCEQQQYACMASITIRDVPDGVRDELAARAAQSGKSLQEYLRGQLIELARRPDAVAWVARVRARTAATGAHLMAERILEHRDAGRR
jgi:plasmid stability protein